MIPLMRALLLKRSEVWIFDGDGEQTMADDFLKPFLENKFLRVACVIITVSGLFFLISSVLDQHL